LPGQFFGPFSGSGTASFHEAKAPGCEQMGLLWIGVAFTERRVGRAIDSDLAIVRNELELE
jgi:hypothetical protein